MPKKSGDFRFRRGDSVGKLDAINDAKFLDECFVDTGDLATLQNPDDTRHIIVGRTGAEKTALMTRIEKEQSEHTLRLSPAALSLTYITNRDTVKQLLELGVNLDPFFKLLWKHVLSLQILALLYPRSQDEKNLGFFSFFLSRIRLDKTSQEKEARHKRVLEYIREHSNDKFWDDSGMQVERIVNSFESRFSHEAGIGTSINAGLDFKIAKSNVDGAAKLAESVQTTRSSTTDSVPRERFQQIVNNLLIKDIEKVADLLRDVFDDAPHRVYILIDQLV